MPITTREFTDQDIAAMINYFLSAEDSFLETMGVDKSKLPAFADWRQIVVEDSRRSPKERRFYYLAWRLSGLSVGHSNINKIVYGQHANIHLHMWQSKKRGSGYGTTFMRQSIACFFKKFELKTIIAEPCSLNPAPNRTLPKLGFRFIKSYHTTPGWINTPQTVNRWQLSFEDFLTTAAAAQSG